MWVNNVSSPHAVRAVANAVLIFIVFHFFLSVLDIDSLYKHNYVLSNSRVYPVHTYTPLQVYLLTAMDRATLPHAQATVVHCTELDAKWNHLATRAGL